jgi:hypothetical protein
MYLRPQVSNVPDPSPANSRLQDLGTRKNKPTRNARNTVASGTVQDSVTRNTLKSNAAPAARPPQSLATNFARKNKTA